MKYSSLISKNLLHIFLHTDFLEPHIIFRSLVSIEKRIYFCIETAVDSSLASTFSLISQFILRPLRMSAIKINFISKFSSHSLLPIFWVKNTHEFLSLILICMSIASKCFRQVKIAIMLMHFLYTHIFQVPDRQQHMFD